MRIKAPKAKRKEVVSIPEDLYEFLADVHFKIGKHDEYTTIECDDCLQCDYAYGGLSNKDAGIYSFTYFPEGGTRHKWVFSLSTPDIAQIADIEITTLDMWACQTNDCRCKFQSLERTCFYCDWQEETA